MKPLKHFHRFFITLSCLLIVTRIAFADESSINQSGHSFPSVELPVVTPVIKTVAFSEDKPLASLVRYAIEKGREVNLFAPLLKKWNLPDDEEYMTGYQILRPTEKEPEWTCVVCKAPNFNGYDIIFVERIPEGANFYLTSKKGKLRKNALHVLSGRVPLVIPREEAEKALTTAIDDWLKWLREREPDG